MKRRPASGAAAARFPPPAAAAAAAAAVRALSAAVSLAGLRWSLPAGRDPSGCVCAALPRTLGLESSAILLQLPRGQTHGGEGVGWGAGGCRGRTAGLGGLWAAPPGAVPGGGLRGPAPGGVGGCRCLLLQGGAEELAEGAGQEREEGRLPGFVLPGDTRSSRGAGPGFPPAPPHFCHYLRSDFTLHLGVYWTSFVSRPAKVTLAFLEQMNRTLFGS